MRSVESPNLPAIWQVRESSDSLARFLSESLPAIRCSAEGEPNRTAFLSAFHQHPAWLFLGATGIAVRYLQEKLSNKKTDPALVVIDEAGRQAIALVGGHEGGANELCYRVANLLGATPVVTTATESLRPLVLGIGCRRDVTSDQVDEAVQKVLQKHGLELQEVREVATIDLKLEEAGLVAWCRGRRLPLRGIPTSLLQKRPWVTESSPWVEQNLGVTGVCEPCALLASHAGELLVPKTAYNGVTIAIVSDPGWQEKG